MLWMPLTIQTEGILLTGEVFIPWTTLAFPWPWHVCSLYDQQMALKSKSPI